MGIDCHIHLKVKEGCEPKLILPTGCEFEVCDCPSLFAPSTHEIDNPYRFYGEGYTRGPWPLISAVLIECMSCPEIEAVWYLPDNYYPELTFELDDKDKACPVTLDRVLELTGLYLKERCWRYHGERYGYISQNKDS